MPEDVAVPSEPKPSISLDADKISNFEDFSIGEVVQVGVKGKVISLSTDEYDKKVHKRLSVEIDEVKVDKSGGSAKETKRPMEKALNKAQEQEEKEEGEE